MRKLLFSISLCSGLSSLAQEADTARVELSEASVFSAAQIKAVDIAPPTLKSTPGVAPLLNVVYGLNSLPGVSSQEGAANTAKFTYRGFGARSQYTTSRTLFYLDNIPITGLQGFSTFEDLNPVIIQSIEMHRPGTNFYPSVLGGAIKLKTKSAGPAESDYQHKFETQTTVGSFGLIGNNLLYQNSAQDLTIGYENLQREGWRENSKFKRQSIFLNGKKLFGRNLQFLLYGIKNRSAIPSSLSQTDFDENPEEAADSWARIGGYEQYDKLISGITYSNADINTSDPKKLVYSLTGFYQYRNGFEPRPFNILDDESHHGGFRGFLRYQATGKIRGALKLFTEYHIGTEEAYTFKNRYDSLSGTYNNLGAPINSTRMLSQLLNAGISWEGKLGRSGPAEAIMYHLGLNSYYRSNDFESGTAESYDSPLILAPRFSLKYNFPKSRFRWAELSVYKGYSIPSLEENLDPDGSLNAGLEPEQAWTAELRFHSDNSTLLDKFLRSNISLYYSEVQNLIVPKVVGADQVVATNSGSSRHTGVEAQLSNLFSFRAEKLENQKKYPSLYISLNGYYGYFAYKSFNDTTGSYNGNRLPGFPEWQLSGRGQLDFEKRDYGTFDRVYLLSVGVQAQATGGYYIDDQNSVRNEPYFLLQIWGAYQYMLRQHWAIGLIAGVKNLTDTHYAAMTVVNNQAFGNSEPRFYYPGDPVNWFSTLTLAYRF